MSKHFDVAIVGGGLVGASLALSLAELPCRIALIDAQAPQNSPTSPAQNLNDYGNRVSAITASSARLLSGLGVWDLIDENSKQPYLCMKVWDELGSGELLFDADEMHSSELGHILENNVMLTAMHRQLQQQKNIDFFWQQKIEKFASEKVEEAKQKTSSQGSELVTMWLSNGESISADLLVAADGAMSGIRQKAGFETREWDYDHLAIVATVETERSHQNTAFQRFSEQGPLAFLPLKNIDKAGRFCSIVWSLETDQATRMLALTDDEFCRELERQIEGALGEIVDVSDRSSFPLRQRHAKRYFKESVVLVGDAAHTIHPLAGQGVNLGFKDVAILSEELARAKRDGISLNHHQVLTRYQRRRQSDNLLMMGAMEGFKRLFGQPDPVLRLLRNTGMSWVNRQGILKRKIVEHAMGL